MIHPRRFTLVRDHDPTGATGTGHVADGVQWPDGTATVRWATRGRITPHQPGGACSPLPVRGRRMTITKFLTARLDEDEHAARSAGGDHWGTMTEETPDGEHIYYTVETVGADPVAEMARTRQADRDRAEHIARHDPARALREIAAKRSLLRAHPFEPAEGFCAECQRGGAAGIWPCPTLRHLAAVYAGHPDYQQEWAP